ncbi:MAG TPA: TonB-dependent receptor [Mucilaginibacter sp.]|nr:TonB-dependent receptor [Mucilaginibacter sp.]
MRKFYIGLALLICFALKASAQQDSRLMDVDFRQANISQIAGELKMKSGYRFYYDPVQFDSFRVTLTITQKTLDFILDKAFENTAYHYVITADQEVIMTKGTQITTSLPAGYFNEQSGQAAQPNIEATAMYPEDYNNNTGASAENKIYEIGTRTNKLKPGNVTLSGYIRSQKTGEGINGASIYNPDTKTGMATDKNGYYSLSLPRGQQTLLIKGLGMQDTRRRVILYSGGKLNIDLQEKVTALKEVTVSAEKAANVRNTTMGVNKLDIRSIKQIPSAFGEADVLRVVLTLPGVQSVGEATTGFNVRGGSADQNLILLNDATIYNPSHFFGFFSAFDPDIVSNIELYKSSIPEKFGGRLSSVLDVTDREGNKKKFAGSAGIGIITSRVNIEGPIVKDKTSFIFGGRTTYSDWLLKSLPQEYKNSSASFYDLNLSISHQLGKNDNLYLTGYFSNDKFRLNSDTAYGYSNRNANIKWKHNFSPKFFGIFTAGIDDYQYSIASTSNPVNAYKLNFSVKQTNLKADFNYYLNPKNTLNFGFSSIYYHLNPGDNEPSGSKSELVPFKVPLEKALESALYVGDKYDVSPDLSINAGLRYSLYAYLGPQTIDQYVPNSPKNAANVQDSTSYRNNQVINTFGGPEIRISMRYNLNDDMSVKASYNTLRQYIHLLSNTTAISPTDVYKLSDPNIKPQFGQQVSLGLYKNIKQSSIETSVEVYYKKIGHYLDYKSGATLLLNPHIERDVINTKGKAYGVEFLIRKTEGNLNGWISYTYSRTFLKQDDPNAGETINRGEFYPANYDKPNDFNFTGNYRFSRRFSISLNVIYSTGRPITYPITEYYYGGSVRVLYSDRNAFRIPDYFRSDFSMNIDGNHKVHQRFHNSWTFGVYNLTGRANAYSTYFAQQGGVINGYQLSIFARPIPFVNYNIRF